MMYDWRKVNALIENENGEHVYKRADLLGCNVRTKKESKTRTVRRVLKKQNMKRNAKVGKRKRRKRQNQSTWLHSGSCC